MESAQSSPEHLREPSEEKQPLSPKAFRKTKGSKHSAIRRLVELAVIITAIAAFRADQKLPPYICVDKNLNPAAERLYQIFDHLRFGREIACNAIKVDKRNTVYVYGDPDLVQKMSPALEESLRDLQELGIYVPPGVRIEVDTKRANYTEGFRLNPTAYVRALGSLTPRTIYFPKEGAEEFIQLPPDEKAGTIAHELDHILARQHDPWGFILKTRLHQITTLHLEPYKQWRSDPVEQDAIEAEVETIKRWWLRYGLARGGEEGIQPGRRVGVVVGAQSYYNAELAATLFELHHAYYEYMQQMCIPAEYSKGDNGLVIRVSQLPDLGDADEALQFLGQPENIALDTGFLDYLYEHKPELILPLMIIKTTSPLEFQLMAQHLINNPLKIEAFRNSLNKVDEQLLEAIILNKSPEQTGIVDILVSWGSEHIQPIVNMLRHSNPETRLTLQHQILTAYYEHRITKSDKSSQLSNSLTEAMLTIMPEDWPPLLRLGEYRGKRYPREFMEVVKDYSELDDFPYNEPRFADVFVELYINGDINKEQLWRRFQELLDAESQKDNQEQSTATARVIEGFQVLLAEGVITEAEIKDFWRSRSSDELLAAYMASLELDPSIPEEAQMRLIEVLRQLLQEKQPKEELTFIMPALLPMLRLYATTHSRTSRQRAAQRRRNKEREIKRYKEGKGPEFGPTAFSPPIVPAITFNFPNSDSAPKNNAGSPRKREPQDPHNNLHLLTLPPPKGPSAINPTRGKGRAHFNLKGGRR